MRYQPPPKIFRRENETDEHFAYRIMVRNFYRFVDCHGRRYWMDRWGPRPPDNEAHYVEPDDGPGFMRIIERPPANAARRPRMPYAE